MRVHGEVSRGHDVIGEPCGWQHCATKRVVAGNVFARPLVSVKSHFLCRKPDCGGFQYTGCGWYRWKRLKTPVEMVVLIAEVDDPFPRTDIIEEMVYERPYNKRRRET